MQINCGHPLLEQPAELWVSKFQLKPKLWVSQFLVLLYEEVLALAAPTGENCRFNCSLGRMAVMGITRFLAKITYIALHHGK